MTTINTLQPDAAAERHRRFFRTDHLLDDLAGHSARSGAVTMVAQAARMVLRLAAMVVLARLLTPGDFGLVAMVTAITGFVAMFKDIGLSMATVQREDITHAQVSAMFWINLAVATVLAVIIAAVAPLIASVNGEPRLVPVALALSLTFIFRGAAIQHRALLRRQMRFDRLAMIDVASLAIGLAAAVTAACLGAGYWALVLMVIVHTGSDALLTWTLCRWRPGLPRRAVGVGSMLAFGSNLTGANILLYMGRNLDRVLLGATWGAGFLGLYSKAYQLLMLPIHQFNQPVAAVAIPSLSRLQHRPRQFRRFYRKAIMLITSVGMPVIAAVFVTADELVPTVLGRQWVDAVPLFRALGPAAFIGTFNVCAGWAFVPFGRTDRQIRAVFLTTSTIMVGMMLGLPWGPIGMAWAFSITTLLTRVPHVLYAFHGTPLRLRDLGAAIWRPGLASLGTVALIMLSLPTDEIVPHQGARLLMELMLCGLLYLAITIALPGGRAWGREIIAIRQTLRREACQITE